MTLNRYELWLDFMCTASTRAPTWFVWKNADSALRGNGDVDAFSHPDDLPIIGEVFAEWAVAWRLGPAFVCRHIPGGSNLVALADDGRSLLEVGTKHWKTFRGSVLVRHTDLHHWIVWDDRGFRRISTGAEAALKLVLNGVLVGGRPDWIGLREKGVVDAIRDDFDGLREFVRHTQALPTEPTLTLARAVAEQRWDHAAALRIESLMFLRAFREPAYAGRRTAFKLGRPSCPIVRTLQAGRTLTGDSSTWIRETTRTHDRIA